VTTTPRASRELPRRHNRRLAQALARHAEAFRPLTAPPLDTPDTTYRSRTTVAAPTGRHERATLEDQVLATCSATPEQINTVRGTSSYRANALVGLGIPGRC